MDAPTTGGSLGSGEAGIRFSIADWTKTCAFFLVFMSLQLQVVKFYLTYNLYYIKPVFLDLKFFQHQVFTVNQEKPGDNGVLFLRLERHEWNINFRFVFDFSYVQSRICSCPGGVLKCMLSVSFEINELVLVVYQRRKWTRGIKRKKDGLYIYYGKRCWLVGKLRTFWVPAEHQEAISFLPANKGNTLDIWVRFGLACLCPMGTWAIFQLSAHHFLTAPFWDDNHNIYYDYNRENYSINSLPDLSNNSFNSLSFFSFNDLWFFFLATSIFCWYSLIILFFKPFQCHIQLKCSSHFSGFTIKPHSHFIFPLQALSSLLLLFILSLFLS